MESHARTHTHTHTHTHTYWNMNTCTDLQAHIHPKYIYDHVFKSRHKCLIKSSKRKLLKNNSTRFDTSATQGRCYEFTKLVLSTSAISQLQSGLHHNSKWITTTKMLQYRETRFHTSTRAKCLAVVMLQCVMMPFVSILVSPMISPIQRPSQHAWLWTTSSWATKACVPCVVRST